MCVWGGGELSLTLGWQSQAMGGSEPMQLAPGLVPPLERAPSFGDMTSTLPLGHRGNLGGKGMMATLTK